MARARWLKPEFFEDRKMAEIGPVGALVYQALWCLADDTGVALCDPELLKARMFSRWRAVGVPEITGALRELLALGRVEFRAGGDEIFAVILRWTDHQKVHKPSKYTYADDYRNRGKDLREIVPEWCGTSAAPVRGFQAPIILESQTPSILDTHTNGQKTATAVVKRATVGEIQAHLAQVLADVQAGTQQRLRATEVRELQAELVFAYWAVRLNHNGTVLDKKRLGRLTARLGENKGDVHELLYVVDGALRDPHLMGQNQNATKYDGIETIFRDRGQVERLAALANYAPGKQHKMATKYLEGAG